VERIDRFSVVFVGACVQADTDKTTPREVIVKRTAQKLIHDAKIQAKQDINFILFQMIYQCVASGR
jgi:hypothetical protein